MGVKDRISWLIENFEGGSKTRFAKKIGIKNENTGLVHKWLSGSSKPKTEYQNAICRAYGCALDWLNDGCGPVPAPLHIPYASETIGMGISRLIAEKEGGGESEFARKVGVSVDTVHKWIDSNEKPNYEQQLCIGAVYGVTPEWLNGYFPVKPKNGEGARPAGSWNQRTVSEAVNEKFGGTVPPAPAPSLSVQASGDAAAQIATLKESHALEIGRLMGKIEVLEKHVEDYKDMVRLALDRSVSSEKKRVGATDSREFPRAVIYDPVTKKPLKTV